MNRYLIRSLACFLCLGQLFQGIPSAHAEEFHTNNPEEFSEVYSQESIVEDQTETSLDDHQESAEESTETRPEPAFSIASSNFLPFVQYINYKYQGDGTYFDFQNIIMEYPPDANGIFQISAFSNGEAVAYILQIRNTGLYELACYHDYNIVEDLRYSQEASSTTESLILPSQLTVGSSFQSGYNNERSIRIEAYLEQIQFGQQLYQQVMQLAEDQADGSQINYYLAPSYGLIIVERAYPDGSSQILAQLTETDGNLIQ